MKSLSIYTIGYEGRSLDDFISVLHEHGIDAVIDVRENPLSRKKGFSRTALAQSLEEASFKYVPARSLGCPRDIRNRYKATRDWATYKEEYLKVLGEHEPELQELLEKASEERLCLLCFEGDSSTCHRSLIADALGQRSGGEVSIVDL